MNTTSLDLFGTSGIDLRTFCERTGGHIRDARDHNAGVASLQRLGRALGLRRSLDHLNPHRLYREYPLPLLEVRDKLAGPWIPNRFFVLTEPLILLFRDKCREWFGTMKWLPYSWHGNPVCFHDLPLPERQRLNKIIEDEGQHNSGRTALYNSLIARKAGEVIRQIVMAHGPIAGHMYGTLLPVTPARLFEVTASFLGPICREEGLDDCALKLAQGLDQVLDSEILQQARNCPLIGRDTKTQANLDKIPEQMHQPMGFDEYVEFGSFYQRLCQYIFGGTGRKAQNRWRKSAGSLLGLIGFMLGIPIAHLLRFQAYYSFDSFVVERTTGKIYFLVVGGHHDAGGLYRIPIEVCHIDDANTHPVISLVAALIEHQMARRLRRTTNQALAVSRLMSNRLFGEEEIRQENIGEALRFIFAKKGRCKLSAMEIFIKANRISEHKSVQVHPALLASNLSGRSLLGLNNYRIEDILSIRIGHSVVLSDLKGAAWADRLAADLFKTSSDGHAKSNLPLPAASVGDWIEFLKKDGTQPSMSGFKALLLRAGLQPAQAQLKAIHILDAFRKQGLLHCSSPLPLFSKEEAQKLFQQAREYLEKGFRAKMTGRSATMRGVTPELLQQELKEYLDLLEITYARPKELWDLLAVGLIPVDKTNYVLIEKGKTAAARRIIELDQEDVSGFSSQNYRNAQTAVGREFLFPFLHAHYISKSEKYSPIRNLGNALSRGTSKIAVSSYYLRHHGLISRIQALVKEQLAKGNFWTALSSLSESAGHKSLSVTLFTYLGAALATL